MIITDSYRALNAELHERRPDYGIGGHRYRDLAMGMLAHFEGTTFLDIGAGKDTLRKSMREEAARLGVAGRITLNAYDPAIAELAHMPEPADIVFCTDVAEHVEPECLDAFLDFVASRVRKAWFMTVATRPAVKTLADGRNAHLIQKPWLWWAEQIDKRMPVTSMEILGPMEVHFFGKAREKTNGAG